MKQLSMPITLKILNKFQENKVQNIIPAIQILNFDTALSGMPSVSLRQYKLSISYLKVTQLIVRR